MCQFILRIGHCMKWQNRAVYCSEPEGLATHKYRLNIQMSLPSQWVALIGAARHASCQQLSVARQNWTKSTWGKSARLHAQLAGRCFRYLIHSSLLEMKRRYFIAHSSVNRVLARVAWRTSFCLHSKNRQRQLRTFSWGNPAGTLWPSKDALWTLRGMFVTSRTKMRVVGWKSGLTCQIYGSVLRCKVDLHKDEREHFCFPPWQERTCLLCTRTWEGGVCGRPGIGRASCRERV